MITTNTIYEPIFIGGSNNFVEVEVFDYKQETSTKELKETGIKFTKVISKGKRVINMNLVSMIKETTLQSNKEVYKTSTTWRSPSGNVETGWIRDHLMESTEIGEPIKVYSITPIHKDINLKYMYIKFITKETV